MQPHLIFDVARAQKAVARQRLSTAGWPENVSVCLLGVGKKSPVHASHISKPVRGIAPLVNGVKKSVGTFLRDLKPWRKVVQCCATLANHSEMNSGVKIRRIEAAAGHQTRNRSGERSLSIVNPWQNLPNQDLPFTRVTGKPIFFTPSTFALTNL